MCKTGVLSVESGTRVGIQSGVEAAHRDLSNGCSHSTDFSNKSALRTGVVQMYATIFGFCVAKDAGWETVSPWLISSETISPMFSRSLALLK